MPRIAKSEPKKAVPIQKGLAAVFGEIEQEVALWKELKRKGSRLTYEENYRQFKAGKLEISTARKGTRNVMRSSVLWCMRKELKKIKKDATKLLKSGGGKEYGEKIAEGAKLLMKIREVEAMPWRDVDDPNAHYLQKDHKKPPATDEELVQFYKGSHRSSFRDAFLISEFCGLRPEEFGNGVRIELIQRDGIPTLCFYIESVKCNGTNAGLEVRAVEVKHPTNASKEVRERFKELATKVAKQGKKNGWTYKVEPTAKQTTGERITNAFKTRSKAAGVDVAAYSMRNRFCAQLKQANKGDSVTVALAMGHQTTETQRHYARANRSKGISPIQITGINLMGVQIRGDQSRMGPKIHTKEKSHIAKAVSERSFSPPAFKRL